MRSLKRSELLFMQIVVKILRISTFLNEFQKNLTHCRNSRVPSVNITETPSSKRVRTQNVSRKE